MVDQPNDDADLLRQSIQGKLAAFNTLYERYQRRIFRFVWHMCESSDIAEEITQETFMHLISPPHRYDPAKGSVAGYLFGMARNLTRQTMQQTPEHLPITEELLEGGEESAIGHLDILAQLDQVELVTNLRKVVLSLPEPYREVLVLRDLEQLGHRETAELLECSLGTVASRLHRARNLLKTRLMALGVKNER